VALKQINLQTVKNKRVMRRLLREEVEMMKSFYHPNVIQYFGLFYSKETSEINIVLEFIDGGSITQLIQNQGGTLGELLSAHVCYQALEGLCFLHSNNIIHRDFKPDNMLIDKRGNVKLIDFGTATQVLEVTEQRRSSVGTPWYTAPEVFKAEEYTFTADIWSLGCSLIEMLCGLPPYSNLNAMGALFKMSEDEHPPLPEDISEIVTEFLLQTFHQNWKERATAEELIDHEFITSFVIQDGENELYKTVSQN